jgi:hypothetical protein
MKKLFVLTVALLTMLTMSAIAQDQSTTSGKKSKKSSTATSDTSSSKMGKSQKLTGTIGQDGKSFTNDADQSSWTISNPDKVKGHEGHHVVLRGKTDDAAKSVDVTSVTMAGEKSAKSGKSKKGAATTPPGK